MCDMPPPPHPRFCGLQKRLVFLLCDVMQSEEYECFGEDCTLPFLHPFSSHSVIFV
jgi:hypothetical protein